jgi:pSer/pThr/pTyr-binding forkhead associated (FHA) protein
VDGQTSPALRAESAHEVVDRLAAQRAGAPYVLFRDGERRQRIVALTGEPPLVHIGRGPACEIALPWDTEVSRVHAILERAGGHWTLVDDGLSRNGSFVNGRRVRGRMRLSDGDELAVGRTRLLFASAGEPALAPTDATREHERPQLSEAQRRVLLALCRPLLEKPFAGPASNREIAEALFLSVDTVKSHLQVLFDRFGVGELPQNRKRAELARRAIESGTVAR